MTDSATDPRRRGPDAAPAGALRRRAPATASALVLAAALTALLPASLPSLAQQGARQGSGEGTSVASVRAGSACLKEEIRVTGFAMAREESGASLALDGYRVTEILVGEGDKVSADQELIRAVRQGDESQAQQAAAGRMPGPPSLSVRAPIAGRVLRVNARIGMVSGAPSGGGGAPGMGAGGMAAAGMGAAGMGGMGPEPMVRIMGESGLDLLVDVPSPYASKLKVGAPARILRDDGGEAKANVRLPVSEVDPVSQLGRARLGLETGTAIRPGQFASAVIETARDCRLAVPRSAVSYQNGTPTVQVLRGTTVETRSVRTGLFNDSTIQIQEGLSDGEPVVANAGTALRSGDKVKPVITDAGRGR